MNASNSGSIPRKAYDTTVADTVESNKGRMEDIEILKSKISKVNNTPARGALKMPATAPAAPQPNKMVT